MDSPMMFSPEWWQQPLGSWMAWNRVTIAFFLYVFGSIAVMGVWEYFSPGGAPRRGMFGLDTTRGDRLFMLHLGSAFIFLAWLSLIGTPLWAPLLISVLWAFFIFRWV